MKNIGKKILQLRKAKNINQEELGSFLGVGKSTISNYETGYSTPDIETVTRLAAYFNVTTDELLGYKVNEAGSTCNIDEDGKIHAYIKGEYGSIDEVLGAFRRQYNLLVDRGLLSEKEAAEQLKRIYESQEKIWELILGQNPQKNK